MLFFLVLSCSFLFSFYFYLQVQAATVYVLDYYVLIFASDTYFVYLVGTLPVSGIALISSIVESHFFYGDSVFKTLADFGNNLIDIIDGAIVCFLLGLGVFLYHLNRCFHWLLGFYFVFDYFITGFVVYFCCSMSYLIHFLSNMSQVFTLVVEDRYFYDAILDVNQNVLTLKFYFLYLCVIFIIVVSSRYVIFVNMILFLFFCLFLEDLFVIGLAYCGVKILLLFYQYLQQEYYCTLVR